MVRFVSCGGRYLSLIMVSGMHELILVIQLPDMFKFSC